VVLSAIDLGIGWAPEGKGLYCTSQSLEGDTFLYVDLKGNARVLWQFKGGSGCGVPSPDGRYLATGRDSHQQQCLDGRRFLSSKRVKPTRFAAGG